MWVAQTQLHTNETKKVVMNYLKISLLLTFKTISVKYGAIRPNFSPHIEVFNGLYGGIVPFLVPFLFTQKI